MSQDKSSIPIERQIAEAKAPPGSPLERLIRENQDFSLLEPEELTDDVELPLWLRVYWRKQHPDLQHARVNPGQGYPDVLLEIYEWMQKHPDLPRRGGSQTEETNPRMGGALL